MRRRGSHISHIVGSQMAVRLSALNPQGDAWCSYHLFIMFYKHLHCYKYLFLLTYIIILACSASTVYEHEISYKFENSKKKVENYIVIKCTRMPKYNIIIMKSFITMPFNLIVKSENYL
jgi:hypothetical protein